MSDLRPEYVQRFLPLQQRRVAHVGVEQQRALLERGQSVGGAVEPARHRHRIRNAAMTEHSHVGPAENLRRRLEMDSVARCRHPADLQSGTFQAMEIHDDQFVGVVHMDIRRCDVWRGRLAQEIRSRRRSRRQLIPHGGRHVRWLGEKARFLELQASRRVYRPRSREHFRVGEADVATLVVGEIQVVPAQGRFQPVRSTDQRRPLDVRADAGIGGRLDDRVIEQPFDPHGDIFDVSHHGVVPLRLLLRAILTEAKPVPVPSSRDSGIVS